MDKTANKYFCYYNLHKHVFSMKDLKTNIVDKQKYSNIIVMKECVFKVSQKGRERVLKEKRKNVHAGVVGLFISKELNFSIEDFVEITYNPYMYDSFVLKDSKEPVESAELVVLKDKKVFAKSVKIKKVD